MALHLALATSQMYAETADMSVGINLSPISQKTVSLPPGFKLDLINYSRQEYLLAYNVFVMNGSVDLAFDVAAAAVSQRPSSIFWRKKLVDVALWSGHAEIALEQWMYLIKHNIEPDKYMANALTLARQLSDYDAAATLIHRQLLKSPNDKQLILQYSQALQNQGFPEQALAFLQKKPQANTDVDYLQQLAMIEKGLDKPSAQISYLQRLRQVDSKAIKPALQLAELLYSQGDITGSYQVYKSIATLPGTKIAFWRSYAAISLLAGDNVSAINAFKQLAKKEAIDSSSLLQMIRLEDSIGQRQAAWVDANAAWKRDKNPALIPIILSLSEQLSKWQDMSIFVKQIPVAEMDKLRQKPEYALLFINLKMHLGLTMQARRDWIWVFQRWPNLAIVQQAYVWFLIDNNDLKQLDYTLKRFQPVFRRHPDLWQAWSSGLTGLGDYHQALQVMLQHTKQIDSSYPLLMNMADMLLQNNQAFAAYYASQKAFYLLRQDIKKTTHLTFTQQLKLIELMQLFGPAPLTNSLVVDLSKRLFMNALVDDQVMAWALNQQSYDLANSIARVHALYRRRTPVWMTLTLALANNDRDAMLDVLLKSPKLLPYRDRVTAAARTGNTTLAEHYAYIGLKEHPNDHEMYKLFQETMLPRANRFSISGGEYTNANAQGPFTRTSWRTFVTPSLSLTPYAGVWLPRTNNPELLAWSPKVNQIAGVVARKYIKRGWVEADIAERLSLETFLVGRLKWHRQMTSKTDATLSLGYHTIATETDALLLAATKNEVALSIQTIIDSHNIFDTALKLQQFNGQDNGLLSTGEVAKLHWQHKFYLQYPDWNMNVYNTWANYKNANRPISAKLQRLIPETVPTNSAFFTPPSYKDVAVTIGVGQAYKTAYTHAWRAFAEAGVLYNFPFGLGQLIEGGIAGSVFGRDHLALYTEYSFNQQQASQKNYTIGIRYDNYF